MTSRQRWYLAYSFLRSPGCLPYDPPSWYSEKIFDAYFYAQFEYPKDPLRQNIKERLMRYRISKTIKFDPDIPF